MGMKNIIKKLTQNPYVGLGDRSQTLVSLLSRSVITSRSKDG